MRGDAKELYGVTRMFPKKGFNRNELVRDSNRQLLQIQEEELHRWKEHFTEILNRGDTAVGKGTWADSNPNISLHTPTNAKIVADLEQINNGKATKQTTLNLKIGMGTMAKLLQPLLELWHEEEIPVVWKKVPIIKLPK